MINENLDRALQALRGEDYTQGHGQLHSQEGEMCVLGVMIDVYMRETGDGSWGENSKGACERYPSFAWGSEELPRRVRVWLGLPNGDPSFDLSRDECDLINRGSTDQLWPISPGDVYLSELNDSELLTLSELADIIERHIANS